MIVEQFRTGGDRNFAYIAADEATGQALVVDPSYWPAQVAGYARDHGLTVRYVFNTHGHHDHTNGNREMEELVGRKALKCGDIDPETGVAVVDGAVLPLGELEVRILHTPGHSEDSICIQVGDALFTGDTLFVGKIGGTDFGEQARTQFQSLHEKLMTLPDDVRVFPGHDVGVAPTSTIGHEKETNPFLLQPDLDSFIHLKRTWPDYKREHGIE